MSRFRVLIIAVLLVAPVGAWLTWRSSHREPSHGAVTRWEIHDTNNGVGLVNAAVRCGDVLFLAEVQEQKIRRFDLESSTSTSTFRVAGGFPFALASDCEADTLYVYWPSARLDSTISALDSSSGSTRRSWTIPGPSATALRMNWSGERRLAMSRISHPDVIAFFKAAMADTYYRGAHLGEEISLDTGTVRPLLYPYEEACAVGTNCGEVSVVPTPDGGWVAAGPGSTRIGVYAPGGDLLRRIDIRTPGFQRTGSSLPRRAGPEEIARWGVLNSSIQAIFPFEKYIATVHTRSKLQPDWFLGRQINWTVLMNVHTYDGALVRADVELADIPVGQDAGGLFVVDYGADGRQSGLPKVTLLRYAVP